MKYQIFGKPLRVSATLGALICLLLLNNPCYSQGPTSSVGTRENSGIYGGPARDLSFLQDFPRLFGAVDAASVMFVSDDTCKTWQPAFPFDSLLYRFGERGWGGSAKRVLTNGKNWVLAHTSDDESLSAAVVSYQMGDFNTFTTAIDPFLLDLLVPVPDPVTSIALTDHFVFVGMGKFLIRTNDTTTFGQNIILARADTLPGAGSGASIQSIAAANNPAGLPLYVAIDNGGGDGILYKYNGIKFAKVLTIPGILAVKRIFIHPGAVTGDTMFLSCTNITNQAITILRTFNAWNSWNDITPAGGATKHLSDADFSPAWVPLLTLSNGLRLSFPGGRISDNLGDTWTFQPLLNYGIASHPFNPSLIAGSDNTGTVVSFNSVFGPFQRQTNIGFAAVNVHNFSRSFGVYYVATDAGLAYTHAYTNQTVTGYDQWVIPNGQFPIPNVGDEEGVSAVAVDAADSLHVVCGYRGGFYVSFSGPGGFFNVTPFDWNISNHLDPYVTDIKFITSNTILAVTGYKLRALNTFPTQPAGNIWKSDNGGLSWYLVTPYTPFEFTMGNCLETGFDGFQHVVYAGTGFNNFPAAPVTGALWKSMDLGQTWMLINDGPVNTLGEVQPVFDIDLFPGSIDMIYFSAGEAFAKSDNGGLSYTYPYIVNNSGYFTSALIEPAFPDSVWVSDANQIFKYNSSIDEADLKFRGYPGEKMNTLAYGSTLSGTSTGAYSTTGAPRYYLDLTLFMEGPFNGTQMNTTLNASGYLPLSQPFNSAPWNYYGSENVPSIPNADIVDWVLVELRETAGDSTTASSVKRINRQACFIKKDGKIVGKDGVSSPRFNLVITEDLYGIIYQPNHVGVMSANALGQLTETFSYNFSTGAGQAYGGTNGHKQLAAGIWGMASGDGNGDGQVNQGDKLDVWASQSGFSGYYTGDFNLDGQVNNSDKNDYWAPNAGFGSQVVP
ncbi:MAG: hypothetical protein JXA03_13645 [Bacteroidales bacterium]|nr:hypothetical protein [Bacteroidales bacterium]